MLKTMYSTLTILLNSTGKKLHACSSEAVLSNQFASYFADKVDNIRSELDELCETNELDNNVCDSTMHKVDNDKCNISDEGLNSCHNCEHVLEKMLMWMRR